jgi:hypothetical protein
LIQARDRQHDREKLNGSFALHVNDLFMFVLFRNNSQIYNNSATKQQNRVVFTELRGLAGKLPHRAHTGGRPMRLLPTT